AIRDPREQQRPGGEQDELRRLAQPPAERLYHLGELPPRQREDAGRELGGGASRLSRQPHGEGRQVLSRPELPPGPCLLVVEQLALPLREVGILDRLILLAGPAVGADDFLRQIEQTHHIRTERRQGEDQRVPLACQDGKLRPQQRAAGEVEARFQRAVEERRDPQLLAYRRQAREVVLDQLT